MMLSTKDTQERSYQDKREELNYRLPDTAVPIHYCIQLIPHLEKSHSTFDGESTIDLEIQRATTEVVLHSCMLVINEARTKLESQDGKAFIPTEHKYDEGTQVLTLCFDKPLKPGLHVLYFQFTGLINEDAHGFSKIETTDASGETAWLGVTNLKLAFARQLFPCWDEPKFKSTFKISLKHDPAYTVLGNMPVLHNWKVDNEDGMVWTHFETTPRMSSYLIAFVMLVNFECISNSTNTINVWYRNDVSGAAKFVLEIAEKSNAELKRFMDEPHKVPKMDHVLMPDHPEMATENWGLIIYDECEMSYVNIHDVWRGAEDTYNAGMVVRYVTRELSHQWIGNLVGPAWWDCRWVPEGLAKYLQYYISQRIYETWRFIDYFVISILQGTVLSRNSYASSNPINASLDQKPTQIPPAFLITSFHDAAAVFRMMSHCLTEEVFHEGIKEYVSKYQYSVTRPDDLWQTLQDVLDAKASHRTFNVKETANSWTNQAGYPLVNVVRNYATGEAVLTQERFICADDDDDDEDDDDDDDDDKNGDRDDSTFKHQKWWVPINFTTQTEENFTSTLPMTWLNPHEEEVRIANVDANDWIIVNIQQTGSYRVNYDIQNWEKIANYLNSDNYEKINVLNRAQIIDDVWRLVVSKRLSPNVLLEVTNYLARETDYIPWYCAFRALRFYEEYLKFPDGAKVLKPHILKLMNKLIESVGFEERPEDDHLTKLKRVEALELASDLGHVECRKIATAKLEAYLKDPEEHAISPNLKPWVFNTGMRAANEIVWNKILNDYLNDATHVTLTYLACSENPEIVNKFLKMTLAPDSPFSDVRVDVFWAVIYSSPLNVNVVIDFLTHNWSDIVSCIPDYADIIDVTIREITSWQQFEKMVTFLATHGLTDTYSLENTAQFLTKAEMYVFGICRWIENNQLNQKVAGDLHSTVNDISHNLENSLNVNDNFDK